MMRGESARQCTRRTLAEPRDDRNIEMADKKLKRKTPAEEKKAYSVTGRVKVTVENHLKFLSIYHK